MLNLLGLKIQGDLGPITCYTSSRHRVVWYIKSPPKEPLTNLQINVINDFRMVAGRWRLLSDPEKAAWRDAARLANLRITGYNLFTYWSLKHDHQAIRTIENQTGIKLLSL